jgi:hypothetical protein
MLHSNAVASIVGGISSRLWVKARWQVAWQQLGKQQLAGRGFHERMARQETRNQYRKTNPGDRNTDFPEKWKVMKLSRPSTGRGLA